MHTVAKIKAAVIMIALIVVFAALPAQAQSTSVDNLEWEGIDSDSGKWELSWDTTVGENYAWLNIKECGVTSVWTAVSSTTMEFSRVDEKTHMKFPALRSDPAGYTCRFQVIVRSCATVTTTTTTWTEEAGNTSTTSTSTQCNKPLAYLDVSFPK